MIRFREESDWPLIWNAQPVRSLARIPGFRQRIIPEPHVPSRGSQARGTRLVVILLRNSAEQIKSPTVCVSVPFTALGPVVSKAFKSLSTV